MRKRSLMSNFKVGDTVTLNPRHAQWHLEHPEIYFCGPGTKKQHKIFGVETQLHLMACMGVPIKGKIVRQGDSDCWGVEFREAGLQMFYYVERQDITKLNG